MAHVAEDFQQIPRQQLVDSLQHIVTSNKFAIPYVDICVREYRFQTGLKFFFRHAFASDYLQEPSTTSSADHAAIDQVINGIEDLVDQRIGAPAVYHNTEFPVSGQQLGECVYIASLQFKPHQRRRPLYLVEGIDRIWLIANIPADHIPKQISRKSALPRIDQTEPLIQFFHRLRRKLQMPHCKNLVQTGLRRRILDAVRYTAHLVLPTATS